MLNPEPIYVELDKKREVAYTVGSALQLKANGFDVRTLMERVEGSSDASPQYRIFHAAVVAWLVACLVRESRRTGEILDKDWAEDQLDTEDKLISACEAINAAVVRYYGEDKKTGGANPPSRARRRRDTR